MSKFRIAALIAAASLIITGVSSCSQNASAAGTQSKPANNTDTGKLSIVCSIFPEYDWVKQIMGDKADNADITYLLGSGVDLHNFQPTADDIIRISDCDLFIHVGGESDEWADDALEGAVNKDMKVIDLLGTIGDNAKTEELKEGMQGEDEHHHDHDDDDHDDDHDDDNDHDHDDEHEHHHDDEPEYDEHVWLSVKNAKLICAEIADKLCNIDSANADTYKANLATYTAELDKLDSDFRALIDAAPVKTVVFGDRFPFRYFVDDYGLDYYAAFIGCSAETEASFETIVFLAQKADEIGAKTIYTIENSDKSIAQTIINSTTAKNQTIAELNSLQSVSRAQADGGDTYISLMRKNYEVLKDTLK
ncbi:MAG: zinc ABC transporter substrate-binding protein [Ruminiclostridium sp.]|nr:zinc ABC transporter substrate-binding protein [Ruminiclostridium sp.]